MNIKYYLKTHNNNVDFLRVILMTMIVMWHFYVHGYCNLQSSYTEKLILPLLCYHVDSFMVISGYYGIKFNIKKLISFYLQLLFYSICFMMLIKQNIDSNEIIANILIPYRLWWYAEIYFYMMLIGPLISASFEKVNKKVLKRILFVSFIFIVFIPWLLNISNFRLTMIFIYILASYINKYDYNLLNKHPGRIYIVCILILLSIYFLSILFGVTQIQSRVCSYTNPIVILASLSLFMYFSNIRKKNKFATFKIYYSRFIRSLSCN